MYFFIKYFHQKINISKSPFPQLKNKTNTIGLCVATMAAAFSALPNVIPKSMMTEYPGYDTIPNPVMLVFVIYVVNSLLFSPFKKSNIDKNDFTKSGKKILFLLVILGVAETSGTLSYTIGLQETSATNSSILVNSETIFAIMLGVLIFREKLQRKELMPFVLIVSGSILIPIGVDMYENHWT